MLLKWLDALYDYKPRAIKYLGGGPFVIAPLAIGLIDHYGGAYLVRHGFDPPLSADAVGATILWATGIVILLYTLETHDVRREMVRQNEIAIRPVIMARIGRIDHPEPRQVVITNNIGRGPAMHVRIDDIEVGVEEDRRVGMRFDPIDYIPAEGEHAVRSVHQRGGPGRVRLYDDAIQFLLHTDQPYNLAIIYENVDGQAYRSVTSIGTGGIRLVHQGRL